MRRILTYIFLFFLAIFLIAFWVANSENVIISFDPFALGGKEPALAVQVPMMVAFAAFTLLGFGLGAVGMWLSDGNLRRRARERKAEIKRLRRELDLASGAPPGVGTSRALSIRT